MATLATQKWQFTLQMAKDLEAQLKKKDDLPLFEDIENLIEGLRTACEATIFLDFEFATKEGVENHLWNAHSLINARYRKMLNHYRNVEIKKHVERRKLEKRYADFIKKSQYFYKGYIQRLASRFSGMKELRRIADRLDLGILPVDERVQVSSDVEHLMEISCHATLLRLGDLSRYRNQLRTKDRSWESALAYYGLAGDLYPDSGSSHNQMAVIALADVNHLDALYHLYRAIAVKEPHPLAKGNLEIEFKKIITSWEKNLVPQTRNDSEATLILWFVRLHAKFYKGTDFSTHDELENEVLSRLVLLLKEQSLEVTLEKFVLTNIAAQYFAGERVKELDSNINNDTFQSFYFSLRFNVRMLFMLLQILQPELEDPGTGEDLPNYTDGLESNISRDKITVLTRRILPALRQYSTWLVSQTPLLVATVLSPVSVYIKEMWKLYADVLTGLANFFSVADLPSISYLLEEDEKTVGFKPLRDPELAPESNIYTDMDGVLKPRSTDPGIERNHPNIEMQARVRDIVLCGLTLAFKGNCPIFLDKVTGRFTFVEEGLQHSSSVDLQMLTSSQTSPTHTANNLNTHELVQQQYRKAVIPDRSDGPSESQQNIDTYMNRMVDSLLEPSDGRLYASNETSYGMHSLTANEIFAPTGIDDLQLLHQRTPKMLPSLPGIWSSPFTPQPNELRPNSPDRPKKALQLSPFQLAINPQQGSAFVFDEMTGYDRSKSSWGRNSAQQTTKLASQPVNHTIQDSLAQQFMPMPMSSSAFADSSSLYANTPSNENRYGGGGFKGGPGFNAHGNNTSDYTGASDFDRTTMLHSSFWGNGQPGWGSCVETPPGGQGG